MTSGEKNEKGGGPGRPASLLSPLGESGQSDGGRLAGRVLACLYNPQLAKKVPVKPKKMTRISGAPASAVCDHTLCHALRT